jgi:ATP-dependent Clp protease ATP-binding subunit ClpB
MKGKLRCVGCSTVEDFRTYIEKDGALARQFSPVRRSCVETIPSADPPKIYVCESTPDETIQILRGLKDPLQRFHKIAILDNALVAATNIASRFFAHKRLGHCLRRRFMPDLFNHTSRLPDSAIDLIDETCAQANLARSANSETVWKLQRSRVVLEMDIRSLQVCRILYTFL